MKIPQDSIVNHAYAYRLQATTLNPSQLNIPYKNHENLARPLPVLAAVHWKQVWQTTRALAALLAFLSRVVSDSRAIEVVQFCESRGHTFSSTHSN